MFVHYKNKIVNANQIVKVDVEPYLRDGFIKIYRVDLPSYDYEVVSGPEAFTIIQTLCPAVLEGKRARYVKNSWAVHNLIGHPLMQIFSWLKLPALGIKIHDATVPEPVQDE